MKINKVFMITILFLAIAIPFASADLITPGYHGVSLVNKIDNMDDFSDYVLLGVGSNILSMCHTYVIQDDGVIPGQYKFCKSSVYAVSTYNFNMLTKDSLGHREVVFISETNITRILDDAGAILLAEDVISYKQVPDSDPTTQITQTWHLDKNKVLNSPSHIETSLIPYVYLLVSTIALVCIIMILYWRKK